MSVNTSKSVTGEEDPGNTDVMIKEEAVPVVEKKAYDLMDDLLEDDVMTLANIGVMNAESFCERTLSCASLIVTDLHTSLSREEVRMLTMIRMNVSLMEYMRTEYDDLNSRIETSETRINKGLRDKAEEQARQAAKKCAPHGSYGGS